MSKIKVLVLYGLPCSGKSSVLRSLNNYHSIAVDTIITKIIDNPSIKDFCRLSNEIIEGIVREISKEESNNYIIEMGCLIPKAAINQLETSLTNTDSSFVNIILTADEDVLIERIISRNNNIEADNSSGIKIDGPDYLTRFKLFFDDNLPNKSIEVNTTNKQLDIVLSDIRTIMTDL